LPVRRIAMGFDSNSLSVFTTARLPRRPLCTDNLTDGCWRERQDRAIARRYLQINPPGVALWLTFDVDRPAGGLAWEEAGLPPPAWSCTTRKNGHGHLAYGLEMPVRGNDLSNKAVRYLEALKEGFRRKLGGDPGYAGLLTKNPYHPDWLVERGLQKLWSLGELAEFVTLPNIGHLSLTNRPVDGLGRNVDTFDRLRFWAYKNIKNYRDIGLEAWTLEVYEKGHQLNQLNSPPLDSTELRAIVKSVAGWVWRTYTDQGGSFNTLASSRGKLGGRPKTTTAAGAPWVRAGISRATWYRRQASGK